MIHVLWFDQGPEVIFQDLGEVILKLGSTKVLENFLPVRRVLRGRDQASVRRFSWKTHITHIVTAEIGLEFSGQNLQRRALSDTIGPHQTQHLTRSWGRKSM